MRLILASGSPRRAEVLHNAGFTFEVREAHVDETRREGETAPEYVLRLAKEKARIAAGQLKSSGRQPVYLIGADTVVVIGGEILGKPNAPAEAEHMLRRLSGSVHEVHTGIVVLRLPDGAERAAKEVTRVVFAKLSADEIGDYVASGEPMDKAGAYGIQGIGGRFVERIEGCYFNAKGLPVARLYHLLRELGWPGKCT